MNRRVFSLSVAGWLMIFSITAFAGLGTSPSKPESDRQNARIRNPSPATAGAPGAKKIDTPGAGPSKVESGSRNTNIRTPSPAAAGAPGAKKIDIDKYYFQPNRNIPKGIQDGEVVLGTLFTPKGSFVQRMTFQKGRPVSVPRKPVPPSYKKVQIRGAEPVTISTVNTTRLTGINSTGGHTPLQNRDMKCSFECDFLEGQCMVCGEACTDGKDWVFGPQTYIDCY